MWIKSLEVHNWGPFKGTFNLQFQEEPKVIFIQGEYQDNPKESNQAGKSIFLESILYVLFGEIRKGLKEIDLISKGEKIMYVKAVITLDGEEVTVKRGRTIEGAALLEIEGAKFKGTNTAKNKELIARLGFTYSDFICSNYFKQGDITQFTDALPSERKKLLQKWFNLERWNVYEVKAKAKYTEYKKKLDETTTESVVKCQQLLQILPIDSPDTYNASIVLLTKELENSKNNVDGLKIKLSQCPNPTEIQKKIQDLNLESQRIAGEMFKYQNKIQGTVASIDSCNKNKASLDELLIKFINPDLYQPKLTELEQNITIARLNSTNAINTLSTKTDLLTKICSFTGFCPVDGNVCDKGTRIPDQKDTIQKDINDLNAFITQLSQTVEQWSTELTSISAAQYVQKRTQSLIGELKPKSDPQPYLEVLRSSGEMLDALKATHSKTTDELKLLQSELDALNLKDIQDLESKIQAEKAVQEQIQKDLGECNNKLGQISNKTQLKLSLEKEIADLDVKITDVKKKVYRWNYFASIFGKDGIPNILISNSLSEIEDFGNIILNTISRGHISFEFTTTKELGSSKESHCDICGVAFGHGNKCIGCGYGFKKNKVKDEVDLKINNRGTEVPFSLISDGAGKLSVSLSLRLGLAKLLSTNRNGIEILILDEIFGSLDSVNRKEVSTLVFNSLKNLLGIKTIFVISHCDLNDLPYDVIKIVRKTDGFSEIVLDNRP